MREIMPYLSCPIFSEFPIALGNRPGAIERSAQR
jgi:hypothetical protein